MPRKRHLPATGAHDDQERWARLFDSSQKVVVYWPVSPGSVTIVGYYSTESAAVSAAASNARANGQRPYWSTNWWHSDITKKPVGNRSHPDAQASLPAWIDVSV